MFVLQVRKPRFREVKGLCPRSEVQEAQLGWKPRLNVERMRGFGLIHKSLFYRF